MKRVHPEASWPESWKYSHPYDLEEIYGEHSCFGYAYSYEARQRETLRLLTEALPEGARVLDIAAAQGNFSLLLAERGYRVTWNDLRSDLADYVRLKYEKGEIEFAPGNAFELAFPTPFDGVLITEIIEHVAHPDEFLRKTAQLVKTGGYIVMTTPNGAYFRNRLPKFSDCPDPSVYEGVQFQPNADGHIFLLHPEEVAVLAAQAGLVLESLVFYTNPLTAGHVKTEPLLRRLPRRWVQGLEGLTERLPAALRHRLHCSMAARFRKPA